MTELEQIVRFFTVAMKGIRHEYYERTVEKAELYNKLVTGEEMDTLLKQFARRESAELFKQRVDITQHIVTTVTSNVIDVFRKVPRSNFRRKLDYEGDTEGTKSAEIEAILSKFWQGESADEWCSTRLLELNATDPNAWVVVEWKDFDSRIQRASPYAFEVASEDVYDYYIDRNGETQYLIVESDVKSALMPEGEAERYTLYMQNRTVTLTQVPEKQGYINSTQDSPAQVVAKLFNGALVYFDGKTWVYQEYLPHNLGFVPAMRVGYKRDMATGGNTFVCLFDAAIPLLIKTVKVNSEFDLTAALIAYPLTIRYGNPCSNNDCINGRLHDDSICGTCNGTGKARPTSAQEEIVLDLPSTADQMIDLNKILTYKSPDVAILQFQDTYITDLTHRAKAAVFNSDIFSRQEIADTATGKNLDLQNVYDTLYPFAAKFARGWKWVVDTVADITALKTGLMSGITIKRDFKLKDTGALLEDLKLATETSAGPAIRSYISNDIAAALMVDEPEAYQRWRTRERFNPFSGKTDLEITTLLVSDLIPRRQRVLYANLGNIFDSIELEQPGFYTLAPEKQAALVAGKLDEIEAATTPQRVAIGA